MRHFLSVYFNFWKCFLPSHFCSVLYVLGLLVFSPAASIQIWYQERILEYRDIKQIARAGEVAETLRHILPLRTRVQLRAPTSGCSYLPVIPAPGDLIPLACKCTCPHMHTCISILAHTHTCNLQKKTHLQTNSQQTCSRMSLGKQLRWNPSCIHWHPPSYFHQVYSQQLKPSANATVCTPHTQTACVWAWLGAHIPRSLFRLSQSYLLRPSHTDLNEFLNEKPQWLLTVLVVNLHWLAIVIFFLEVFLERIQWFCFLSKSQEFLVDVFYVAKIYFKALYYCIK